MIAALALLPVAERGRLNFLPPEVGTVVLDALERSEVNMACTDLTDVAECLSSEMNQDLPGLVLARELTSSRLRYKGFGQAGIAALPFSPHVPPHQKSGSHC